MRRRARTRDRGDGDVALVAEEDPDEASVIAAWLRRRDVRVVTADSGAEALSLAHELEPDWVIVNGLPDMSAVELAHRLRSSTLDGMRVVAVADDGRRLTAVFDDVLRRPLHGGQIDRLMNGGG